MDTGPQAIENATELAQVRRQARSVHIKSLAVAMLLAVVVMIIPTWR